MGNRSNKPLVLVGAPGNRFAALPASRPLDPIVGPSFDAASSVAYLWVGTVWQTWRWPLLGCGLGFVALLAIVATTGVIFLPGPPSLCVNLLPTAPHTAAQGGVPAMLTRLRRFVRFKPDHAVGAAQLWCARLVMWLAVPCVAVVTILNCFVSTSLYTCGAWLTKHSTIAYINGPAAEWALAVAACAFPCAAAWVILQFQQMLHGEYKQRPEPPPAAPSSAILLCMFAQWAALILICTIVPFAYAISTSVPGEALGGGAAWILPLVSETTSLMLSIITTLVIPWHCRSVSHRTFGADGNPLLTSRLMQLARLWISILAPVLSVVLVHEDCLGGWVLVWPQCVADTGNPENMCSGKNWMASGHCSRAVIENLESLLLSKLAYSSFLVPAGVLMQHTAFGRRTKQALVRCFKPTYMASFEADSEFAAVLM